MANMPDHNGFTIIHYKSGSKSTDHVKPKAYQHVYAIEKNGYLNPGQWATRNGVQYWMDRTSNASANISFIRNHMDGVHAEVHNRALEKLMSQLDICQNLFESWYERRQAYDLLIETGKKILDFAVGWRKPTYWRSLGKGLKTPSSLPEAWLTYQFGIKPLVGTVDTCMNNLAQPLPSASFSGTATKSMQRTLSYHTMFARSKYVYKLGCVVQPNPNPNLALANIGGLSTPFSTAWSVIPWGWAVDYFVNASQLLSNLEVRHPGVTIKHGYTTRFNKGVWFGHNPVLNLQNGRPYYVVDGDFFIMERTPTLDLKYKPELKFPLLGDNKAANLFSAIALSMKGK